MEILLKNLVWLPVDAESNFINIRLLGTFRTCVETSLALELGNPRLKSVRRELKYWNFVLLKCTVRTSPVRTSALAFRCLNSNSSSSGRQ